MSHGRESANFSYMDGVPVKIGEKYKPPRKVTLPLGFQHRLSYETASEEYDFRLERSVLEKMGEWRSLRKAEADNRKERIKAHEDAWQKKLCEDVQKFSIRSTTGKFENVPPENSGASSISHSDPRVSSTIPSCLTYPESGPSHSISYTSASLTPTPNETFSNIEVPSGPTNVQSIQTTPPHHNVQYPHRASILTPVPFSQNSNSINSTKSSSQFNFSDFEADTSSPFDNMELKTINEMEELAHVLQPISNSPDSKENSKKADVDISNSFPSTTSSYSANQNTAHYNTIAAKPTKDNMMLTHINGLTGYSSYSTTPRTKGREVRGENYVNAEHNVYDSSTKVPMELTNMFGYYPHQTWNSSVNVGRPSVYHTMGNRETEANVASNITSAGDSLSDERVGFNEAEPGTGLNSTVSFPSTEHQHSSQDDQPPSGRTLSKSVPDIVQELEKELAVKRVAEKNAVSNRMSHTPPPRPNSFGSTGLEDWKPWPDLDSPEPTHSKQKRSPAKQAQKDSDMPNPLHELPVKSQQLVKHISEMGFALPRVARACQLFGEDDKKVIEFLLQIQALEEKKWPGDLAEKALVTNKHNIAEAVRFLEALTQLLDLGFPEDKVSEALVMFHNDRDKALDHLIS
ncbi:hypothetical protein R5R35_012333 [Gryllus longicercus]|uniref:Ubiquitin-associated protein 1 n=1 Tax=Gryllus longicercus TaxID=2509291 RepID=A0AAN9V5L2_9ORTH